MIYCKQCIKLQIIQIMIYISMYTQKYDYYVTFFPADISNLLAENEN